MRSSIGELMIWKLTNDEEYFFAINQIQMTKTGFIRVMDSNLFFDEACQCLINAINLFQLGYFDVAFCSLRQSIEISIGSLYLVSNKDVLDRWNNLENGFEKRGMVKWLRNNEMVFHDMRHLMSDFFDKIYEDEKKMNKYIHKQGFQSFYVIHRGAKDKELWMRKMQEEFEQYLTDCIGAVAVYRLSLDAFPVALSDEDLSMRAPCLITEALSEEFLHKYIGDSINAYKKSQLYKDTVAYLRSLPKQSEAVYYLVHYQYVNRNYYNDYINQWDILDLYDRLAVKLFMVSNKISRLFVDGMLYYCSETESNNSNITCGNLYFEELFSEAESNYNLHYNNAYLSRIYLGDEVFNLEHNTELSSKEIEEYKNIDLSVCSL